MAQKLNVKTSIVDYLKSVGKDSSFSNRAKIAVEQGIVKNTSEYMSSANQNVSLLKKLSSAGVSGNNPLDVQKDDATSFINSKQNDDIDNAKKNEEPEVRQSAVNLIEDFKNITGKNSLTPDFSVPSAPNFEETFQQLRGQYGVKALEGSINELDAQEEDLQAQLRQNTNTEIGKPVALNVIEGRVSEQERNFMERIDFVQRQKARAVDELQAANDTIENMMTFKKMDYDAAKERYDTEFSQNIQLFNTIKGASDYVNSENDRVMDNARSNLQIIYNSLEDGSDINTFTGAQIAKIQKMELQAGLPQGFYNNIATQKPDAKVLSTTTRETGGIKYADIIYKNTDGSVTTQQVKLGSASSGGGSGKPTESELQRAARSEIAAQLNNRRNDNNYVSPQDYKKARSAWVTKGFSVKDFDESFATEYANPDNYSEYGVSLF